MSEKMQETITDIVAEMRRYRDLVIVGNNYCNRIEAAHRRDVDRLNSCIQATVSRSDAEIDRLRRELSKTRPKNGADFGQFDAEALRDALKEIEATVTAALAHQPEYESKCGQFLYDALVKCFNIADLACNAVRTESGAAVSRESATAENSSAVGDCAKLREAMKRIVAASIVAKNANAPEWILQRMADIFAVATTALSALPRNCDVGTAEEQQARHCAWCRKHGIDGDNKVDCIHPDVYCDLCALRWSQMPYEEGGAK